MRPHQSARRVYAYNEGEIILSPPAFLLAPSSRERESSDVQGNCSPTLNVGTDYLDILLQCSLIL